MFVPITRAMAAQSNDLPAPDGVLAWPSEPMLCRSIDHLPEQVGNRSSMSYEPKFDGFIY